MNELPEVVLRFVEDLPEQHVAHLTHLLQLETGHNWGRLSHLLRSAIPQLEVQEQIQRFINEWQCLAQPPSPAEMAHLLQSVSYALAYHRRQQKLELTWTGPQSSFVNLRRTEQALKEIIDSANERILIVSFAVYKAKAILAALDAAADRSVDIKIILETPKMSEGKIAYNTLHALGRALREKSRVYIWPTAKRPINQEGKIGALHAKVGVADGWITYISSANLTDFAMTLNMEMGLLLRSEGISTSVEQHFNDLITEKVLMEVERVG